MKESMQILIAETDTKIVNQLKNYLVSFDHKVFPVVTTGEDLMKNVALLAGGAVGTIVARIQYYVKCNFYFLISNIQKTTKKIQIYQRKVLPILLQQN